MTKGMIGMGATRFNRVWLDSRSERVWRHRSGRLGCALVLATALLGSAFPQGASAQPEVSLTPSTTEPYYACPYEGCQAINEPPAIKTATGYVLPDGAQLVGSGVDGSYTPEELELAYNIPKAGGKEQTVAVIDAHGDTTAESDLETYRKEYKLYYNSTETACRKTSKGGNGCFKKVNQEGKEEDYPAAGSAGWGEETSLDLDMVSAACPECHILLVEANNEEESEMGAAVNKAVELGATEISSSYGFPETYATRCPETGCSKYQSDYNHPGIPITVSAGDFGYDDHYYHFELSKPAPMFPASSPTVIAVGGTALHIEKNARSSENVWDESGSGCSVFESTKPAWQKETEETEGRKGCTGDRADSDVAADASCETPVSIYSTPGFGGWHYECGTSVASPFVAGIEAHANADTKSLGADAFYKRPSMLFHVSEGSNWEYCTESEATWYLCHATKEGYNGPTGMGTPDGVFDAAPPAVTTGSATSMTETEATLHGSVNPNGLETTYYFEYGTTTAYGKTTAEASAGSGASNVEVSKVVTGLAKGTKYDFRIVATNSSSETSKGSNQVFTTHPFWAPQEPPNPTGASSSNLSGGLSCSSSASCFAGGSFYTVETETNKLLIEQWNGTAWSLQEPPDPTISKHDALYLTGISCASSSACVAVGYFTNSSGVEVPLSESWNGTSWSLQEPPTPTGATRTALEGVSCTSSTACIAVGFDINAGKFVALAETWNGTSWSLQSPPSPTGATGSILFGMSCTSATACTAVGVFGNSSGKNVPLAERWNGTTWSVQEPPGSTGAKETELDGVSCTSATACQAVGVFRTSSGSFDAPFAESWNGTSWTTQEVPVPVGETGHVGLLGVSCTSSTVCAAVGSFDESGEEMPLAERWNGTAWSVEEPPIPTGAGAGTLSGVSCTSSTACFAGGKAGVGTLAEDYH
jgi:hypothetical protein